MFRNIVLLFPIFIFVVSCTKPTIKKLEPEKSYSKITADKDTLYSINDGQFEYGSSSGFANKKGDTIIPIGTFDQCFSDTFATFAYVFDKKLYGKNMVAINRNKEVIFEAFLFDNGPDYLEDGLFRIKRNGKIGYANQAGEIIIEPKYECAYPFENGKAKVAFDCETIKDDLEHTSWESSNWFFIDKKGDEIN